MPHDAPQNPAELGKRRKLSRSAWSMVSPTASLIRMTVGCWPAASANAANRRTARKRGLRAESTDDMLGSGFALSSARKCWKGVAAATEVESECAEGWHFQPCRRGLCSSASILWLLPCCARQKVSRPRSAGGPGASSTALAYDGHSPGQGHIAGLEPEIVDAGCQGRSTKREFRRTDLA